MHEWRVLLLQKSTFLCGLVNGIVVDPPKVTSLEKTFNLCLYLVPIPGAWLPLSRTLLFPALSSSFQRPAGGNSGSLKWRWGGSPAWSTARGPQGLSGCRPPGNLKAGGSDVFLGTPERWSPLGRVGKEGSALSAPDRVYSIVHSSQESLLDSSRAKWNSFENLDFFWLWDFIQFTPTDPPLSLSQSAWNGQFLLIQFFVGQAQCPAVQADSFVGITGSVIIGLQKCFLWRTKQVAARSPWVHPILVLFYSRGWDGFAPIHLYSLCFVPLKLRIGRKSPFAEIQPSTISLSQPPRGVGVC